MGGEQPERFEYYVNSNGRSLRLGITTGTCAVLASMGAVSVLFNKEAPDRISVMTPKGIEADVRPYVCYRDGDCGICAVKKDGGDDKDVTDGLLIYARARLTDDKGIVILGGEGVGRVTKPGLDRPVGDFAINTVPRTEMEKAVYAECEKNGYEGGVEITISVPGGEEAAKKTFNENLGIVGGISIIGTSGIVEPMSLKAFSDTVRLNIRQKAALGHKKIFLVFGNYGLDYLKENGYDTNETPIAVISNFVGDAIDEAAESSIEEVILVGHAGKLIKLAGGIMNTHSSVADARNEIFTAHAAVCGADALTCKRLLEAATADACIEISKEAGIFEAVISSLLNAIGEHLRKRAGGKLKIKAVMFSKVHGYLGETVI